MTRPFLRLLALLVVVLATLAQPQLAQADDAAAFSSALEHFHAKRFDQALPIFRDIVDRTGSPNARMYYARTLRESGDLAQAYEQMQRTVRDATAKAKSEERYVETRNAAASELAELEPRIGKLIVVLVGDAPSPSVTINGNELAADRLGKPFAVAPGSIAVAASAEGREPADKQITLAAGATETVTLSLAEATAATTSPEPQPEPDEADDEPFPLSGIQLAGLGVAVIGVGGMVLFGVAKAKSDDIFDTVESECGGVRCSDPAYGDQIDEGKTFDTLTNVGLIVGIVGLAGGAAMIIFGGNDDDSNEADETAWSLGATPDGFGASVSGRF